MNLSGARAVITGGSSGIGAATASVLAARGAGVVLVGRDDERLAVAARRLGGEFIVADLADPTRLEELARLLAMNPPDVVIHSAGVGLRVGTQQVEAHQIDEVLRLNLTAPMVLTGELLPGMLARGSGHLVFIGSIAGALGVAQESVYAASKAGLGAFAASLRTELVGTGIGVTAVLPGVVDTEFFDRRGVPYTRQFPVPMSADRVARRIAHAIERNRAELIIPSWLRIAVAVKAVTPGLYARLADRLG